MLKRLFDIISSFIVLLLLLPLLIIITFLISLGSKGGPFYRQKRIGKNNVPFNLLKFRTMKIGSDKKGLLTVGNNDNRITKIGSVLRKYKLDELPQLINILKGQMSVVGPRPEVEKYVKLYDKSQLKILNVKPGLTDYASLEYLDENKILAKSDQPEATYIKEVMPAKLKLNQKYISEFSLSTDIKIIFLTISKILSKR